MGAAFVQAVRAALNPNDPTISLNITASSGNLLAVFAAGLNTGAVVTVDDGTNTYTAVGSIDNASSGRTFYAKNITGGALTVTATWAVASPFRRLIVHEVSGLDTTSPLDVHAENTVDTDSGSAVTTANGDYIFGCAYSGDGSTALTAGTGFTLRQHGESVVADATEDQVQSTAGSINATFGGGPGGGVALMVAFKAAATATDVGVVHDLMYRVRLREF